MDKTLEEYSPALEEAALDRILALLRSEVGHDFSLYKTNTINRRIERRMNTLHLDSLDDYADYLASHGKETKILLNELLIGVTSFFRDIDAYASLKICIMNQLKLKPPESTYRVWIPACSTGEEAYSTAILLQECTSALNNGVEIQIFASDIDENAIATARAGLYSFEQLEKVDKARLNRFFTKKKQGEMYRIHPDLREKIVFAPQSVIKDPPFTRMDLISCRNLLIYLGAQLQKKLLPTFHYSLNPGGVLFLGASESVGGFLDHFNCLDKKYKIYRRREFELVSQRKLRFPIKQISLDSKKTKPEEIKKTMLENPTHSPLDQLLLEHCLPPCVITDKEGEIIYIHGSMAKLLGPTSGVPSLNIVDMAGPGLETKLSYAIREINRENSPVIFRNMMISEPYFCEFHLMLRWIEGNEEEQGLILISFEEVLKKEEGGDKDVESTLDLQDDSRTFELERELKFTKESLQSTIEELKSTNEELQSTNEELQSTNEELETSKEELVTVNSELEDRIDELTHINDDIKNLLDSTHIATIFLDNSFNIKRYTPKTVDIIRLIPTDIGRSIFDIVHNLKMEDFFQLIEKVMKTGSPVEREIESTKALSYFMRVTPYNTTKGCQEGVVLTFEDITEMKQHQDELESLIKSRTLELQDANQELKKEASQRLEAEKELRCYQQKHAHINRFNTVGEIASGIAHEINQPLSNITNYVHGIQERMTATSLDKEGLSFVLEKLMREAERASNIVNNMRNLIQKKPLNKEKVNINQIIHDVVEHLSNEITTNKITLDLFLCDDPPPLFLDPLQMEQVLTNILVNAIEAVKGLVPSHRVVRIRTESELNYVWVSIEDDGKEIPNSVSGKIFDLFYTTKSDGLGMGLAITRTIIESYGGYINYISDGDRHNVFKITLPVEGRKDEA